MWIKIYKYARLGFSQEHQILSEKHGNWCWTKNSRKPWVGMHASKMRCLKWNANASHEPFPCVTLVCDLHIFYCYHVHDCVIWHAVTSSPSYPLTRISGDSIVEKGHVGEWTMVRHDLAPRFYISKDGAIDRLLAELTVVSYDQLNEAKGDLSISVWK